MRVLVLLCVAATGAAYECDPGRSNASARATCAGWSAQTAKNWSNCELVLGCCWQLTDPADNASLVCYAPQHASPTKLPAITNPLLTEMSFFGQPAADAAAFLPLEQSSFVTFGTAGNLTVLAQARPAAYAARPVRRTLSTPQVYPGHSITAAGALLKSSLWAVPGGKEPDLTPAQKRCRASRWGCARSTARRTTSSTKRAGTKPRTAATACLRTGKCGGARSLSSCGRGS